MCRCEYDQLDILRAGFVNNESSLSAEVECQSVSNGVSVRRWDVVGVAAARWTLTIITTMTIGRRQTTV